METTATTPKIFVTDYASYNEGKQFEAGQWYDLDDYTSIDELFEAIQDNYNEYGEGQEIEDLELMVTYFEGFPKSMYSESFDADIIAQLIDFANMDDEEREKINAFIDCFDGDLKQALENYEEAYQGYFNSDEDFAEEIAEQMGLEQPNNWPYNCIDWERAAKDLMYDYSESGGHYFWLNF